MKISVIIPVYNEARNLPKLLRYLCPIKGETEVIVVDGGSTDGCTDKLPDWVILVKSEKGRAKQLNKGAQASTGEILFFLHADSFPPKTFVDQIIRCIRKEPFGFFGITFTDSSPLMRICAYRSNRRAVKNHIVFGDQGMFMTRTFFDSHGGFPDVPLMEDYIFSLNLRKRHIYGAKAEGVILTSARRYKGGGLGKLKTMYQMYRLRCDFRRGVPIQKIADRYRDIR